jgi:cytochrome b subunit of formate dehydrogenase
MSVVDEGAGGVSPVRREAGAGGRVLRWLPIAALVVAVLGAVAVLPVIGRDEDAQDWYRGQFGGSSLYTADAAFALLLPFLIAAGIAVAVVQRERPHKARVETGATLRRHELTEVVIHWLNAAGMVLCLITAAWLLRWFDNPFSLETTYVIHFAGAALILVAVAHHLTYQFVGGGTGLLPRSGADVKNAAAELAGYTGVYRGLPGAFNIQLPLSVRRPVQRILRRLNLAPEPAGKYLATEKVISYTIWAVLIGIVVLTGIVKTLNYVVLMPGGLLDGATFLHDGATIFIVVFLVIHVAALALVPRNWPLLTSMFTTRISRAYAKEHLPLWQNPADGNDRP